jgi:hypothetical protein
MSSAPSTSNEGDGGYSTDETPWEDEKLTEGLQATLCLHHDVASEMIRGLFCETGEKQIVFNQSCSDLAQCPGMFIKIAKDLHQQRSLVPLNTINEMFSYHKSDLQGFKWELRASSDAHGDEWSEWKIDEGAGADFSSANWTITI